MIVNCMLNVNSYGRPAEVDNFVLMKIHQLSEVTLARDFFLKLYEEHFSIQRLKEL